MSYGQDFSLEYGHSTAEAMAEERAAFIRRTYSHLAGAILAFVAIEFLLFQVPNIETRLWGWMAGTPWSALILLAAFIGISMLARTWAASRASPGLQYLGLGLYVIFIAVIFLPLLIYAYRFAGDPSIVPTAGILTLAVFGGLTATVFTTGKDFSFLGPILWIGSLAALGFIIAAIIFGLSLGMFFVLAMIVLFSGYILYDTSNVLHHYPTDMHVAAALELFASIAMLFWYMIRLLLILSSRD